MRFHWWIVDLCLSCSVSNHVKPFQSYHYLPFVRSSVRAMCKLFQVAYARATNSFRYSTWFLGKVSHAGDDTKARLPCRPERRGLDDNRMICFRHLEMSILWGYPSHHPWMTFLYWNRWPGDPPFWETPTSWVRNGWWLADQGPWRAATCQYFWVIWWSFKLSG